MLKSYDVAVEGVPGLLVRLEACEELLVPVQRFFETWPLRIDTACPSVSPLLTVSRALSGEYSIRAPWLVSPIRESSLACFLCSLSIELVMAVCRSLPPLLHMHAAAVQLPEGLCMILGSNHAGKSTLVTRLMADGCIGFGDDLVGIMPSNEAFSFGIPPRLRLPFPSSSVLRAFVHAHAGEADEQYAYLESSLPVLAPFGTRGKIAACIFLQRRSGRKAVLRPCASGLRRLLPHCVLYQGTARAAFESMQSLASCVACFVLEYDDLDSAADLLLAHNAAVLSASVRRPAGGRTLRLRRFSRRCMLSATPYRRKKEILFVSEKDGAYLVDEGKDAVFHLNSIGEQIWRLLEYPLSAAEAAAVLHEAFPGTPYDVVGHDVKRLFQQLILSGLIEPCLSS